MAKNMNLVGRQEQFNLLSAKISLYPRIGHFWEFLGQRKDRTYVFQVAVGVLRRGAKELVDWVSYIKFVALDALGSVEEIMIKVNDIFLFIKQGFSSDHIQIGMPVKDFSYAKQIRNHYKLDNIFYSLIHVHP